MYGFVVIKITFEMSNDVKTQFCLFSFSDSLLRRLFWLSRDVSSTEGSNWGWRDIKKMNLQ